MPTPADLKDGTFKRNIKLLNIGPSGSGKTHFAATFPKCFFILTEPGGDDTFLSEPSLLKNIVRWEYSIPQDVEGTKTAFENLDKYINEARTMAEEGKIETLVLDNITYLSENMWMYINHHQRNLHLSNQGNFDALKAYGTLARWMYEFVLMKLLSMPCNVIVNCHEQLESDEALAKKPDKSSPVVPSILGGFRNSIEGMFSYVFFLTKLSKGGNQYEYWARTNKGNGRNGKSRLKLPDTIKDISYETLKKAIDESHKEGGEGAKN